VTREDIEQFVGDHDLGGHLLFADGFDDCIIGLHFQAFNHAACVVYDRSKMLEQLVSDGMKHDEADEYFDFNISGAYVGEMTPIYVNTTL